MVAVRQHSASATMLCHSLRQRFPVQPLLAGCRPPRIATKADPSGTEVHMPEPSPGPRRWGEKRAKRPPRGCSSRPASLSRQNRFRHLLTICRGISRRDAMRSFRNPVAASKTIFARITSRYGDVYFRALRSSSLRSSLESLTLNGLDRGINWAPIRVQFSQPRKMSPFRIRHRIYE